MIATRADFRISTDLENAIKSLRTKAGAIGLIFLILTVVGAFADSAQFFRSYLYSFVFWSGLSIGCLSWLMVQYLSGGAWGVMSRRVCEAGAGVMPLWVVLFIPLILGISSLYGGSWANPNLVAHDPVLQHKAAYLNTTFWIVRGFVYLGGWTLLQFMLNRWSAIEDRDGGVRPREAMAKISAPGLIFTAFAVTFMSTDWIMSVNAHWFSTMFGLLFIAGEALSSLCFIVTILVMCSTYLPLSEYLTKKHMHDLGKLMLATVMLFTYFSFSQFLITWAGNLPEEIPWYKHRLEGGWEIMGTILVLGHFALPFALLLSQDIKKDFKKIRMLALLLIVMRLAGVFWETVPEFFPGHLHVSWMDFTAPIGLGGIFLTVFLTNLLKKPLIPPHNPNLEEALAHGRH
ncbi:MAG TPA: hypothetical protein VHW24_02790 [Bryobacteraceae bacterium]|jgi:hypothetical protein|nr:hypothetical protein [Bryobacteraceae bacterium]